MLKKGFLKVLHWLDPKNRAYVSEADQFLERFDLAHPEKSDTQLAEIDKHRDIFDRPHSDKMKW